MNQGAKILLGVLAIGGIAGIVFAGETAHAKPAPKPPVQPPLIPPLGGLPTIPPQGGIVVVPPTGPNSPQSSSPPPLVVQMPPNTSLPSIPTLPGVPTGVVPGSPTTATITLPGLGTFNPATGHVFDARGIDIGTFDPLTGRFTPTGSSSSTQVTPPLPPVPTQVLPGLTVTPGPSPTPGEPPASPAEQSSSIKADTLAAITAMLAQEHSPHWRIIPEPALRTWQQARGLVADGAYGPKTALKMGEETGLLPIIRGWPKGTSLGSPNLNQYRSDLRLLASKATEPRRSQLLAAAVREQGQGYGTPEKPISTLITLQDG